ncbi:MAG TPA: hypothetical protein VE972_09390 [Conexibacter sp.]|nr:hypothetical protein [Conexibacter sp.]
MHESEEEQRSRLAYEAALRALDQQRRSLEEIRSRTGVLLAAASVSASFLGSRAFERHADVVTTSLALMMLVLTLLLGILALTVREDLAFSMSGSDIHTVLLGARNRADQHRYIAGWLTAIWARNEPTVELLNARFRTMAGALAIQIVLWALALSGTVSSVS